MSRFEIEEESDDSLYGNQNMPKRIDQFFMDDDFLQPKMKAKAVKPALKNTGNQNELAAKQLELHDHKNSLKPASLIDRVKKLSGMGYSENERLLKLKGVSICYYSKVPKELQGRQHISINDLNRLKLKPKQSLYISSIVRCEELTDKEIASYKKLYQVDQLVFKIVFDKRGIVKGEIKPLNGETEDSDQDDQEVLDPSRSRQFENLKGNQTWFINCGQPTNLFGSHRNVWIKHISLRAMQLNPGGFHPGQIYQQQMESYTIKTAKLFQELQALKATQNLSVEVQKQDSKQTKSPKKSVSLAESVNVQGKNPKPKPSEKFPFGKNEQSGIAEIDDIIKTQVNINKQNLADEFRVGNKVEVDANRQNINQQIIGPQQTMSKERKDEVKRIIDQYSRRQSEMKTDLEKFEQQGWDMKYQNTFNQLVQTVGDQKRHLKISERFIEHIGKFRTTAKDLVKRIVNELHLPEYERSIKPVKSEAMVDKFALFFDEDNTNLKIFYDEKDTKNIIIKLTHQGDVCSDNLGSFPFSKESIQLSFQDYSTSANMQTQLAKYDRYWRKQFGREHLSNDVIFDAIYLNAKPDQSFRLRVPLTAIIDYKGFRAMAIAKIQISQMSQPDLGFYDGSYLASDALRDEMGFIGEVLNLRDNRLNINSSSFQQENIPVSSFIRVYQHQQYENRRFDGFDSPTSRRWFECHYEELDYNIHPKFILNTSEIFPLDLEIKEIYPNRDRVLRPEFLCSYEFALKADTKRLLPSYARNSAQQVNYNKSRMITGDNSAFDQNEKRDELEQKDLGILNEAARFLRVNTIQQFVDYLDNLVIVPIDSESLAQAFHVSGINMRYLGQVASKSELPHIKDICINEMIARTLKRLFNTQISSLILNHQEAILANQKSESENRDEIKNLQNRKNSNIILNQSDFSSSTHKRDLTLRELEQKRDSILKEKKELNQDMESNMQVWMLDFMNLVFGRGSEHDEFFNEVVLPEASANFDFKIESFKKHQLRLNALYYALIELIGVKVTSQELRQPENDKPRDNRPMQKNDRKQTQDYAKSEAENFFKNFGKEERPFGSFELKARYHFELVVKSRTLSLRNLPYTILSSKFKEYKDNGYINDAIESCRMRSHIRQHLLDDEADTQTQADLCQIYLDRKQWVLAQKFARKALKRTQSLHAQSIKFYCILMQAFYMDQKVSEADVCFTKALEILDHHWGPFHPLHINVYGIMAQLLLQKGKHDDAIYLYKASLLCCMRILGPNHIQTADVHMDFGKLYLIKNKKSESLQHFIEAYLIYDSYFGQNALQTAEAAINVATILEEDGKVKEAFIYAKVAASTYTNVFSVENPTTIQALWQQLSISYALKEPDTVKQTSHLLNALSKRDLMSQDSPNLHDKKAQNKLKTRSGVTKADAAYDSLQPSGPEWSEQDIRNEKLISDQMDHIKTLVVATAIMEITRKSDPKVKKYLKRFCDKTLFKQKLEDFKANNKEGIPNLIDYHLKNIDPMKISQVKGLKFSTPAADQLLYWYQVQLQGLTIEHFEPHKNNDDNQRFGTDKNSMAEIESPFIIFFKQKIDTIREKEEQEENRVMKSLEMGTGVSGLLVQSENEEKNYNGPIQQEGGNEMMLKGIGIFGTYAEESGDFDYDSFFLKLIQTFDNINFYNLLIL